MERKWTDKRILEVKIETDTPRAYLCAEVMLFASAIFLGLGITIFCGVAGLIIGLWIGSKLPLPENWRWKLPQRTANAAAHDPEMDEARKRAHEIARKAYPELVR